MSQEKKEKPGRPISKKEFKEMCGKYDKKNPGKTRSVIYNKETFKRIMENPDTENIAIYMGETEDDKNTVLVVGLNSKGAILYSTAEDRGLLCPPNCPSDPDDNE